MKPNKLTVFQLFERERRYVVPLYQRPYVWNREEQWEPLWQDIAEKAAVLADGDGNDTPHNHFLGAVVLNRIDTFGKEVTADEIIDGQQRLTTLQIFLTALRDIADRTNDRRLRAGLQRLTENDCVMDRADERFKVWPTNADRDPYTSVLEARSVAEVKRRFPTRMVGRKTLPRHRFAEAYLYFYEAIELFAREGAAATNGGEARDEQMSAERISAVYQVLKHHLHLVVIELEDDDDPQVIFETLNARGEPLLPSDLIRNFAFLRASRANEDIDRLYADYWRRFDEEPAEIGSNEDERFWKKDERQGRLLRPRIDLFFFHYLTYQTERDFNISHLFQEFKAWWLRKSESAEAMLRDIREHALLFKGFFVPQGSTRLDVFAERVAALDTNTVYPLLLFLAVEEGQRVPYSDFAGILTDLESYLVRRAVCDLTTKNYNRLFLGILRNLRVLERVDRGAFREQLLAGEGESVRWPNDKEFGSAWLTTPVYPRLKSPRCGMILRAIEAHRTSAKQESIRLQGSLEVEHILPQTHTLQDYPYAPLASTETKSEEERQEHRKRMIETFGNLTLLTRSLNASVRNGPFHKKRPEIARQSALRLNAYFQDLPDDTWDENRIFVRGLDLLKSAIEIWPHPQTGSK